MPERQYLIKTYSEKGGSYGMQMTAFDDARFVGIGGQTEIIFNLFAEAKSDAIAQDPTAMNLDDSREGMLGNLLNLKRLLESP